MQVKRGRFAAASVKESFLTSKIFEIVKYVQHERNNIYYASHMAISVPNKIGALIRVEKITLE